MVRSLSAALRQRLEVSVADVGDQTWQRATLGVAVAASSETGARRVAQQVEDVVSSEHRAVMLDIHIEIVATER